MNACMHSFIHSCMHARIDPSPPARARSCSSSYGSPCGPPSTQLLRYTHPTEIMRPLRHAAAATVPVTAVLLLLLFLLVLVQGAAGAEAAGRGKPINHAKTAETRIITASPGRPIQPPRPPPIDSNPTDEAAAAALPLQQEQQQLGQEHELEPDRPFLRHRPDPLRGAGQLLPSDARRWAEVGMKEEREVVVPPAPQEATAAPPPECPKNSRFSFCAIEPVGGGIKGGEEADGYRYYCICVIAVSTIGRSQTMACGLTDRRPCAQPLVFYLHTHTMYCAAAGLRPHLRGQHREQRRARAQGLQQDVLPALRVPPRPPAPRGKWVGQWHEHLYPLLAWLGFVAFEPPFRPRADSTIPLLYPKPLHRAFACRRPPATASGTPGRPRGNGRYKKRMHVYNTAGIYMHAPF
jgi:hypothetical protein